MAERLKYMGQDKYRTGFELAIHEENLYVPKTWKKPKLVFVNSMSDLFHEKIPLSFIEKVFKVMNETPQHIYQVLTKRSRRLREVSGQLKWSDNIWMGVSVENQKNIFRIADLVQTGANVKFLSLEPLIDKITYIDLDKISWVIVGGESGPGARSIKKEWIKIIQEKCQNKNVPFFFKQWGKPKFNENPLDPTLNKTHPYYAKGGCQIDGMVFHEFPLNKTSTQTQLL